MHENWKHRETKDDLNWWEQSEEQSADHTNRFIDHQNKRQNSCCNRTAWTKHNITKRENNKHQRKKRKQQTPTQEEKTTNPRGPKNPQDVRNACLLRLFCSIGTRMGSKLGAKQLVSWNSIPVQNTKPLCTQRHLERQPWSSPEIKQHTRTRKSNVQFLCSFLCNQLLEMRLQDVFLDAVLCLREREEGEGRGRGVKRERDKEQGEGYNYKASRLALFVEICTKDYEEDSRPAKNASDLQLPVVLSAFLRACLSLSQS